MHLGYRRMHGGAWDPGANDHSLLRIEYSNRPAGQSFELALSAGISSTPGDDLPDGTTLDLGAGIRRSFGSPELSAFVGGGLGLVTGGFDTYGRYGFEEDAAASFGPYLEAGVLHRDPEGVLVGLSWRAFRGWPDELFGAETHLDFDEFSFFVGGSF